MSLNRPPPNAPKRRAMSLNRPPPKTRTLSLNRPPPKTRTMKHMPREVGKIIQEFARPSGLLNVSYLRPSLKIMETEDVYDWFDYIFGTQKEEFNDSEPQYVLKEMVQKGPYQILHFNPIVGYQRHWDEFYIDLDRHGALWIPKVSVEEQDYNRNYSYSGVTYYTRPTPGCWQIQYANPRTSKRIFDYDETTIKRMFPESYEVEYTLDGKTDIGYIYSRRRRPKVEMTPFLPDDFLPDT